MADKPGWLTWWWGWFPREEPKNTEKLTDNIWKPKKVEWRLWYTLAEVEELLKKQKTKKD